MSSDIERVENKWLDWPDEGWLASEWDLSHIGCAGLAFFMYIIPGIIFVIVKSNARSNYQKEYEVVKKNHDYVFNHTGCHWLASATHLGGHPLLPYRGRVVIGIKSDSVGFYDYGLQLLHSVQLNQIQGEG